MIKFLAGVIVGLAIAAVGVTGLARILDRGVQGIQNTTKELAQ